MLTASINNYNVDGILSAINVNFTLDFVESKNPNAAFDLKLKGFAPIPVFKTNFENRGIAMVNGNGKRIELDKEFFLFSEEQQVAIFLHEVGHVLLHYGFNHDPEDGWRYFSHEVEADLFAVLALGKVLGDYDRAFEICISEHQKAISLNPYGNNDEEEERIEMLLQWREQNLQQYIR